ncbi:MAG: hypothetical protein WC004_01975 [Candidatus Absconditabacterales bacterium]
MRKSNNIVVVCRTLLLFAIWLYGLLLTAGRDAAFATGDLDIASGFVALLTGEIDTGSVIDADISLAETGGIIVSSGISAQELIPQAVVQWPQYGDIQIVEVFPSSGNCLDEFVTIRFAVSYSGFISIYGLGTSAGVVTVRVDQIAGSNLMITDNIAGAIPGPHILLVNAVTLTNGGELLKVMVSGQVLDEVYYSNLQGVQSLYVSSLSGSTRLFTTNGPASIATRCGSTTPAQIIGTMGGCDIRADSTQYLGTGLYTLSLQAVGQYTTGCRTDVGVYGEWLVNGSARNQGACAATIPLGIGINTIEFRRYEGDQVRCRDEFIFASQYDVGVVKQYVTSPGSLSCTTQLVEEELRFVPSDCGLKIQGSRLGFFASSSFNIVTTVGGKDIYNNSAYHSCKIDMGNGVILEQCNPSSYRYADPGVYDVVLDVYDVRHQQSLCRVRSFINVPPKSQDVTWQYDQLRTLQTQILQYCSISNSLEEQEDTQATVPAALCELAQQTGSALVADMNVDETVVTWTGAQTLSLHSVLPNPVGSDSLYESVVLFNSGSLDVGLSAYTLVIKNKKISLSGAVSASGFHELVGGWGLRNDGMCIGLNYNDASVDTFCYDAVKEGELVVRSGYHQDLEDSIVTKAANKKQARSAKDDSVSKQMSCTEKIKIAKASEKEKYKKLQLLRQKEKQSYQQQLAKRKTKELLARNKQYLYNNMNNLILSDIKTQWPDVWTDGGLVGYLGYAQILAQRIDEGYIYTDKRRTPTGWRYEYTNNIKQYTKKQQQVEILDIVVPYFSDYVDHLYYYQINSKTVAAVNGL